LSASAAGQPAVFNTMLASDINGGTQNWMSYDDC
jgi:hypothetical protein